MPTFVLLPSPLLGPATWRPVAEALRDRDLRVLVATVAEAAAARVEDAVLVPHSNAGYFAPVLAAELDALATVYVDAALPLASSGEVALAPPSFYEFLERLADPDGMLPPWTEWWGDLGDLFPDPSTRREVEEEQPRLPLSYFAGRVPVVPGWAERPSGFLAFGETYTDEIEFAYAHGWPVIGMAGEHLHQLHEPEAVAEAILTLAEQVAR